MDTSEALPLLFEFTEEVFAVDFSAQIRVGGRALVVEDDEETHLLGLDPAGASGGGADLGEAWRDFRSNFKKTIEDFVYLTDGFEAFEALVLETVGRAPEHMEVQWAEAVERVKTKGEGELELKRTSTYSARGLTIRQLSDAGHREETGVFTLATAA